MNDEEPGLSEAEEARIRALLAAARHDEPMPDAVVARLDRVLAGLADEPLEQPLPANVVPLAERRRRAARMLVAAAAVVLVGLGVDQLVHQGSLSSADSSSAGADSSRRFDAPESQDGKRAVTGSAGSGAASAPAPQNAPDASAYKVRPQHFAKDSERVQRRYATTDMAALSAAADGCDSGTWGAGHYVPVRYGRAPAYLVLRRPAGDSQVADLFLCGSDEPVRSITLPGP